eukprot:COSAG04_NODE_981_length_9013_cov_4.862928_2_plen_351_part_00
MQQVSNQRGDGNQASGGSARLRSCRIAPLVRIAGSTACRCQPPSPAAKNTCGVSETDSATTRESRCLITSPHGSPTRDLFSSKHLSPISDSGPSGLRQARTFFSSCEMPLHVTACRHIWAQRAFVRDRVERSTPEKAVLTVLDASGFSSSWYRSKKATTAPWPTFDPMRCLPLSRALRIRKLPASPTPMMTCRTSARHMSVSQSVSVRSAARAQHRLLRTREVVRAGSCSAQLRQPASAGARRIVQTLRAAPQSAIDAGPRCSSSSRSPRNPTCCGTWGAWPPSRRRRASAARSFVCHCRRRSSQKRRSSRRRSCRRRAALPAHRVLVRGRGGLAVPQARGDARCPERAC